MMVHESNDSKAPFLLSQIICKQQAHGAESKSPTKFRHTHALAAHNTHPSAEYNSMLFYSQSHFASCISTRILNNALELGVVLCCNLQ
jgi:hypothetical protein